MSNTQHFGRVVRERREDRGWSLRYTAELCELCDKSLEQIELGDVDPKLSNAVKIAQVLDIDLGFLTPRIKDQT